MSGDDWTLCSRTLSGFTTRNALVDGRLTLGQDGRAITASFRSSHGHPVDLAR